MKSVSHNLAHMLLRSAALFPDYPAVAVGKTVIRTYAQLLQRVQCLASTLRERLNVGDRVIVNSQNCAEYLEVLYACWWAGMIAVPINAKLHDKEVRDIVARSGAKWCFFREGHSGGLDSLPGICLGTPGYDIFSRGAVSMSTRPEKVLLHDPAWIFFTSGTTGKPKGAVLTHRNLLAMCNAFLSDVVDVEPVDAMVHAAPLSHGSGLYAIPHVYKAACNVVLESGGFDAHEASFLLDYWDRSVTFGPPTVINRILAAPKPWGKYDPFSEGGLKAVIYGGGPLYRADLDDAWKQTNGRVAQIYGQGESPCTITAISRATYEEAFNRHDDALLASVGTPQAGVEVTIGEGSEVLVRGPQVMSGYWSDVLATGKALLDGWLHTGDKGRLDERGLLTLTGRAHDTIISGGSNIYPAEVENLLLTHPAVKEAAVLGRPHADLGQQVVAFVVTKEPEAHVWTGLDTELNDLCLANIARFKRPRAYHFLSELPMTNYGKVDRFKLTMMAGQGR